MATLPSLIEYLWLPISLLTGIELRVDGRDGKQPDHPRDFLEEYDAKYGSVHPPFFQGTFAQAKHESKKRKALLVVCFISQSHDGTPRFLRETIGNPVLSKDYQRETIVFWVADVYYEEYYSLALSYEAYEFPAVIVFAHVDHRLLPLELITGMIKASDLLSKTHDLQAALIAHEATQLESRAERTASQRIRDEQDAAYRRSLEVDAKKEQERRSAEALREEERAKEQALLDRQIQLEKERQSLLDEIQSSLPSECGSAEAIRLSLQLLDGTRVIRKWAPHCTVRQLYDWAFVLIGAQDLSITQENFSIRTMFPPVTFSRSSLSFQEAGIQNQMKLIIELNQVDE